MTARRWSRVRARRHDGRMTMRLSAGTSGFRYDEWRPAFYPPEVRGDAMLRWYASQLPAVEAHNTFYRMPAPSLAEGWRAQVGDGFRFAVKAPMGIANRLRLRDCEAMLAQLAAALPRMDWQGLRKASHVLIALAGTAGMTQLEHSARAFNSAANESNSAVVSTQAPAVMDGLAKLLALVVRMAQDRQGAV